MANLAAETAAYVDRLHRSVRRWESVLAAKDFCRYAQFSGLLGLIGDPAIAREIDAVLRDCTPWLQGQQIEPQQTDLDLVNAKLDRLLALATRQPKRAG